MAELPEVDHFSNCTSSGVDSGFRVHRVRGAGFRVWGLGSLAFSVYSRAECRIVRRVLHGTVKLGIIFVSLYGIVWYRKG